MQGGPPPPPPGAPGDGDSGATESDAASLPRVEDILTINPTETLLFESRPQEDGRVRWEALLMLKNTSGFHVAFKVKTTAPQKYIVRPNKGVIDPETTAHVRLAFHVDSDEIPHHAERNDRFMFECAVLKQETVDQLDSHGDRVGDILNLILKKIPKSQLMKKKYNSHFQVPTTTSVEEPAPDDGPTAGTMEGEPTHSNVPQSYEYATATRNTSGGQEEADFHSRQSEGGWVGHEGEPQPIYDYASRVQSQQEESKQTNEQTVEDLQEQLRRLRQAKEDADRQCQSLEHQKEDLQQLTESTKKEKDEVQQQLIDTSSKLESEERRRRKFHEKYDKLKEEIHELRDAKEELDALKEMQADSEGGYQFSLFQVILMAIIAFMAGRILAFLM